MTIVKYAQLDSGIDHIFPAEVALANNAIRSLLLDPKIAEIDPETQARFVKFAKNLKKVAPKANDFLYASAIMLHSAEAALIDQESGEPLKDSNGKEITSEWKIDKKTGSWKWVCSNSEIKPYKNCFVPGTKITMADGSVKCIENIVVGDEVITHNNRVKKVLRIFENKHNGTVLEFNIRGSENITCTMEHPFYKLDVVNKHNEKNDASKKILRLPGSIKKLIFEEAQNLSKGDILLSPVINDVIFSDITPGKARLLGLFAAEGCFGKKYGKRQNIRFTFSRNEYDVLAVFAKKLLEQEFCDVSVKIQTPQNRNTCEVTATGKGICDFFYYHVGEYSNKKKLSNALVFGNSEVKENFIIGWLDGDGCVEKQYGQIIGITTSENLANQIVIMLNSLKIGSGINKVKGGNNLVINKNYRAYLTSDNYRITINATENSDLIKKASRLKIINRGKYKKQQLFFENYALHTVTKINESFYNGNVYNFEVEDDNSYVANGIIVHNCNGDIFPEPELKKAYRKWIGRPLCKDHQSSSVDGIRGIIVDAYYDDKRKRVIGLFAIDKVNYPDLARKVASGYAKDVSMGTAVGRSICFECGNVAKVESDYCQCVRDRKTYGEINIDLSPIELSLVVTGADPRAKLRNVIASLNKYSEEKEERIQELQRAGCVTPAELSRLDKEIADLRNTVSFLLKSAAIDDTKLRNLTTALEQTTDPDVKALIEAEIKKITQEKEEPVQVEPPKVTGGQGFVTEPEKPTYQIPEDFDTRFASSSFGLQINAINEKLDAMVTALRDLGAGVQVIENKEDQQMSDKLRERAAARRAMIKNSYFQGGGGLNEPQTYPVDPTNDKLKTKGDKQMEGQGMEPGSDGLHPGYDSFGKSEEELKKMLSRAELEERKIRRHALVSSAQDVGDTVKKTTDGKEVIVDSTGKVTNTVQNADIEQMVDDYLKRHAYFQGGGGVNEPQTYPVDPTNDKLKTKGDKQMEGQGMESGSDGMHPGYKSTGPDKALKEKLLRADEKLRAKFVMAFKNDDKTIVDKANSRWEVYAGSDKILEATGKEIYEDLLEANWENLASKRYGREVLRSIRKEGLDKVAYLLKGAQPGMPPAPDAGPGGPGPMPPMPPVDEKPEEPEKAEKKDDAGKILDELTECLENSEKLLGDLKDSMEVEGEKDSEASELPSAIEAASDADDGIGEIVVAMDQSADELAMLAESIESRMNAGNTNDAITSELINLSAEAVEENRELCKQAAMIVEAKKGKKDKKEDKKGKKDKKEDKKKEDKKEDKKSKKAAEEDEEENGEKAEAEECEEKKDEKKSKAEAMLESLLAARATKRRSMVREAMDEVPEVGGDSIKEAVKAALEELLGASVDEMKKFISQEKLEPEHKVEEVALMVDDADADDMQLSDDLANALDEPMPAEEMKVDDDVVTASDRKAWRAKVAAETGSKYQLSLTPAVTVDTDMPLQESHALEGLDTKTPEANVEGIVEMHEKIMKQVQSLPKVREAMEHIGSLLKSGKLNVNELDDSAKLQALAVDPAAAKYYKDYFGQGDAESKKFGNDLVQDYSNKKKEASLDESRAKMRIAYDMALEMQEKGMINSDPATLHAQVDEIMKFDDRAFASYKKALSRVSRPVKTASASVPALQVGVNNEDAVQTQETTIVDQLKKMW